MPANNHWSEERWDRLTKRLCADFGPAAASKIIESIVYEIGGERVTFPSVKDLSRKQRNMRICRLFEKGSTYEELSVNFDLSTINIKRIIHRYDNGHGKDQPDERNAP